MNEIKVGSRVYIKTGYGYTAYINGIEKFRRAICETFGNVIEILPKRQVKVMLDVNNGWSVITDLNCVVICNSEDV